MLPSSATCTPASVLTSVDLPAPLSPTSAMISPGATSRSTPLSASTWPKVLRMPRIRSRAAPDAGRGDSEVTGRSRLSGAQLVAGDEPVVDDARDIGRVERDRVEEERGHGVASVVVAVREPRVLLAARKGDGGLGGRLRLDVEVLVDGHGLVAEQDLLQTRGGRILARHDDLAVQAARLEGRDDALREAVVRREDALHVVAEGGE